VIAAIFAPVYLFCLPSVAPPGSADGSPVKRLVNMDWTGFTLSAGSLVCLVMGLTFGGDSWEWSDGRTIATFVVSGSLLFLTFIQQRFAIFTTPETRMSPPGYLLKNRSQILLNIQTAATVTNIFVPLYYIPLYFQFVHGDTAIKAAVRLLPFILLLVATNMASGYLLPTIGY
jgi:hypothetical protein